MHLNRRRFLESVGGAALSLGVLPGWSSPREFARSRTSPEIKNWTWVLGGRGRGEAQWGPRFARIREGGIHAVLVSGGDLDTLAAAAHSAGLEFHRWIWVLNRPGDAWAIENHPEWYTVNRNGDSCLEKPPYVGYYKWVCPTRREVREYLQGVVADLAGNPAVDGVHLDYIRHPDVILPVGLWSRYNLVQDREYPEFDFCYCEVCRETFRAQSGVDPLELDDPTQDAAWREFRWNSVTGVVRVLAQAVRAQGKRVTAAVFPTPTIARKLVRQAWDEWQLDAFFPMLYHRHYDEELPWIGTATAEGVSALPPGTPLYSGLFLDWLEPDELLRATSIARDAGAAGVSLFEMGRLTDEHLLRLREVTGG